MDSLTRSAYYAHPDPAVSTITNFVSRIRFADVDTMATKCPKYSLAKCVGKIWSFWLLKC